MKASHIIYTSLPLSHKKGECPICKASLRISKTVNVRYVKRISKKKKIEKKKQITLPYCEFCGLVFADADFPFKDNDEFYVNARKVSHFIFSPYLESERIRHDCQTIIDSKIQIEKSDNNKIHCERCHLSFPIDLIEHENGHKFCAGCKALYDNNIKDLLPGTNSKPIITVNFESPTRCRYYDHNIENVLANVLFLDDGEIVPHIIDMSYCPTCNRFYIFNNVLLHYEEKYGKLLIERVYQYWNTNRYHIPYEYAPDTILSRWGYCAQEGKQCQSERRAILACMMSYNRDYKEEIKAILNHFINTRKDCYKAIPIWTSDLIYVCEFDIDQAFLNLTKWQK